MAFYSREEVKERLKWEAWSNLRDLGYNVEYEELFVLLDKLKLEHKHENRRNEIEQVS